MKSRNTSFVSVEQSLRTLQEYYRDRAEDLEFILEMLVKSKTARGREAREVVEKALREARADMAHDMRAYFDVLVQDATIEQLTRAHATVRAKKPKDVEMEMVSLDKPSGYAHASSKAVTAENHMPSFHAQDQVRPTSSSAPTVASSADASLSTDDMVEMSVLMPRTVAVSAPVSPSSPPKPQQSTSSQSDLSDDELMFIARIVSLVSLVKETHYRNQPMPSMVIRFTMDANGDLTYASHEKVNANQLRAQFQGKTPVDSRKMFGYQICRYSFYPPQQPTVAQPKPVLSPELSQETEPTMLCPRSRGG